MKCGHDGGGVVTFNDEQDVIHLAHVGRDCSHRVVAAVGRGRLIDLQRDAPLLNAATSNARVRPTNFNALHDKTDR